MRRLLLVLALLCVGLTVPAAASAPPPTITTLSNRADLISGGDVLVQVKGGSVRSFTANGKPFALTANRVLVTGLPMGRSTLKAVLSTGSSATLVVTNHPNGGPVFAGPQVQPWVCATDIIGLGAPVDKQCNTKPVYTYDYYNTAYGHFVAFDPASPPPSVLIPTTTTDEGKTVPFVVRVESGVMDRGLYQIATLVDGWNHKVASPFGGSCHARHQQEQVDTGPNEVQPTLFSVLDPAKIGKGFMVAHNAMGNLGSNCNDAVAAEALMMLKERIVEQYGSITRTIGYGCSGGSMLQHLIAANYPGLLDGITPACSFPDLWSTATESEDCHLMEKVFLSDPTWLAPQQSAVSGYPTLASCIAFENLPADGSKSWFDPALSSNCGDGFTASLRGLRCDIATYDAALLGHDALGRGLRPFDNVGVEYGLRALRSGDITAEQFVRLNEQIGADDLDWKPIPGRLKADPVGVRNAYAGGRITDGHALADVPILDLRGTSNQEIHTDFHSYELRARLDEANGTHANQVIWTSHPLTIDPISYARSFFVMDDWVGRIQADHRPISKAQKVALDKPPTAVDSCWEAGVQITDPTTCGLVFPHYGDTRSAAGGRVSGGVIACALAPLKRADYAVTDGQWARLLAIYPHGVCDYSKPGQQQVRSIPWATYVSGGPVALPAVPRSRSEVALSPQPAGSLAATGLSSPLAVAGLALLLLTAVRRRALR